MGLGGHLFLQSKLKSPKSDFYSKNGFICKIANAMKINITIIAVLNFQEINYDSLLQKKSKSLDKIMSSWFGACQAVHQDIVMFFNKNST